jgi:Fur family ferric uptake transcriptional regulator
VHIELPEDLLRQVEAQTGIKISEYTINFYGYRDKVSDEELKI